MKRIAILATSYFPNIWNGQGRSTFSTAYYLASKGHEVEVFTFTAKGTTYKQQDGQVSVCYIGGVTKDKDVISLPFADTLEWNRQMLKEIISKNFDTIILMNSPGWVCAKAYKAKHPSVKIISFVPFLYSFTGWIQPVSPALEIELKAREAEFVLESDILIAHTLKFGKKLAIYANKQIYVIPNCHLDLSESQQPLEASIKGQLCFVGRANREKSLERIIRVLPELDEATLVIASPKSSVEYLTTLQNLAKKLDVEHRVFFVGWKPTKEIRQLYKASALAIVPSQFEPYGYSALDPMALGCPVIVSEWTMLEDYLGGPENVFSSLAVLTEKIQGVLSYSKTEKQTQLANNRQRIDNELSVDYIGSQLESLL